MSTPIKRNLSPAFLHVSDRPQVRVPTWVLLGTLAQATKPAFVRHVQAKGGGYSLTVYDSEADAIFRTHCDAGVMSTLRAIERRNSNVSILGQHEFVHADRCSVGLSLGSMSLYYSHLEAPALTD